MKVAIVYYSFSGNTKKACLFLNDKLALKNNSIEVIALKPKIEEASFLKQCVQAFFRKRPPLEKANYDLSNYDFIIFASPVWAFTFAPALHSYLKEVKGLQAKKVGCFLTFGSGAGASQALRELENILRQKNARILFSKSFSGAKTKYNDYLEEQLQPLPDLINSYKP